MSNPYKEINRALCELLLEKKFLIEPSPRGTSPLFLLLTLKTDKVGFAILDDKPEQNYLQAFEKIRKLYSIHSNKWADFDLTLVLCKRKTEKVTDEFCNKIEIDPYFCRKFVIDLNKDIKSELGRLPFISLSPESIVDIKRPISAQTFLMKHGATSDLARYLVVPHARGIERIVKECLEGVFRKPTWVAKEIEKFQILQDETRPNVWLKELEIRNFRAYNGKHKFDLDANLVVLFGPNGLGKTSFFDAIDFVCTGGVARFDRFLGRKIDRLLNVLKHLDSSIEDSFVKATTLVNGKEVQFKRYMKNRTQTYIQSVLKDRTKTLMELTGFSEKPSDLRIENFVRLFRATHLFGQEYQSLTSGFRRDSRLPEDTVSRMLALQDYVEAINKTKKVSEELKKRIREKESEITSLKSSLDSNEIEMKKLFQSAKIIENPKAISAIGKEIVKKIIHVIDIPIEIPKEFKKEIVQDWRTKITVQKTLITQKVEEIEKLEAKLPEIVNYRKRLKVKLTKLTHNKEQLDRTNKDFSEVKKSLNESDEKVKKMFFEERNLSSKRENLNWLFQVKVEHEQLKKQGTKENKRYPNIKAKIFELLPKIEKIKSENKVAEQSIIKNTAEINILEKNLKELSEFEKSIDDWLKAEIRNNELKVYLQKIEQELVNVKNELRVKKEELNASIIFQDKLEKFLNNLQQDQTELQTLLDNIERHIFNNICPVCGTIHNSREELIEKLKIQRGIQPKKIREALESFEDVKARTKEFKKYESDLELRLKQSKQKAIKTQTEILDMEGKIKTYEEKATSLDIPITPLKLKNFIDSKKKNISEQINIKQHMLFEQKSKTNKLQGELTILIKQQGKLQQDIRDIESRQKQLRSMIDNISNDASTRQVSLEMEKEIIQRELTSVNSVIKDLHNQIEIEKTENNNLQKELDNLLEKNHILKREIQGLNKEVVDSKKYIEEVESLTRRLNLNLYADINRVTVLKNDLKKKLFNLNSLYNEIINFEIAMDTMQISVALAKMQQDLKNIKAQIKNLEKEREPLNNWLSYFDVICKELGFVQNQALKEYTNKFGPFTSNIQRRLRAVYGFGDIELHPEKGEIDVRVERKGERDIPPSDYFSESQIQIVMLSIFLSATLTQTWSSFKPILLDDPVEHFDDLNAYSLLDLIKGLIMKPGKGQQFFISTCEERLFRLMRQKFSKLNGKVIFYMFESIGENGPKIVRL
jgi:exonuclease SbcC